MVATSPVAAATSVGTCLRECERHTLQSTRAHSAGRAHACLRVRAHTFVRRLRTVAPLTIPAIVSTLAVNWGAPLPSGNMRSSSCSSVSSETCDQERGVDMER